jgi:hypothetical protein
MVPEPAEGRMMVSSSTSDTGREGPQAPDLPAVSIHPTKKAPTFVGAFLLGFDLNGYAINNLRAGSFNTSFTQTKKLTLFFLSMMR